MGRKCIDLTGQRFGKLIVLCRDKDYISPIGKHEIQWKCKCDCGNEIVVLGTSLKGSVTKSCGCLRKETGKLNGFRNGKLKKKYNQYDLAGEYGIGYTSNTNKQFYFDLEDYDKIKDYCWYENSNGYIVSKRNKKIILIHRIIMNCPDDKVVDHKNGSMTIHDNRKFNLRIGTSTDNNMNRKLTKLNTSGAVGVSWFRLKNQWRAHITVNKKFIHLGYFDNFEDAVKARKEAEKKYFGEFSYDNSRQIS